MYGCYINFNFMMVNELATKEDFIEVKTMLKKIMDALPVIGNGESKEILTSKEVKKILSCSDGTLSNYRSNGFLKGKKLGGRYYYSTSEITNVLNSQKGGICAN